jgi:hypothetical protein
MLTRALRAHLAAGDASGEAVTDERAGAALQRERFKQLVHARALLRKRL